MKTEPLWIECIAIFIGFIFLILSLADMGNSAIYYPLLFVSVLMLYPAKLLEISERVTIDRRVEQLLDDEGLPPSLRRQSD